MECCLASCRLLTNTPIQACPLYLTGTPDALQICTRCLRNYSWRLVDPLSNNKGANFVNSAHRIYDLGFEPTLDKASPHNVEAESQTRSPLHLYDASSDDPRGCLDWWDTRSTESCMQWCDKPIKHNATIILTS